MTEIPETIAQRYIVKGVIGSGGMGQVLRAFDPNLDIDVAIKILHSQDTESTAVRLQREAIAAGKLNHKNIARVFNFGQTAEGAPYMVMEYLSGIALSDQIKKMSHLPVDMSLQIFEQICSGLKMAHQMGIVHRDLKPSNIMLLEAEAKTTVVKILDFGVAKLDNAEQKLTSPNAVIGSPLYMSPEQASAMEVDSRSDIYSLGCLMFECLTGIVPLKGKTALETISLHRGKAPPLITDIIEHENFPEKLSDLVNRCLAKLPEQRPQSVSEIIDELNTIEEEIAISKSTKQEIKLESFIKSTSTKKLIVWLGGVLVLSLIIFVPTKWYFEKQNEQRLIVDRQRDRSGMSTDFVNKNTAKVVVDAVSSKPTHRQKVADGRSGITFTKFIEDKNLAKYEGADVPYAQFRGCMLLKGPGLKYLHKSNVGQLGLESTTISDDALKYVGPMQTLTHLYVTSPNISDKGVAELVTLKNLKVIGLGSDKLTDKTAELLTNLPNLFTVILSSDKITDKSVDWLRKLKLISIGLVNTKVSENIGLKIVAIPTIKDVTLSGSKKISTQSLAALSKSGIFHLDLTGVPLTEEHIKAIAQNKYLSHLDLVNTQVKRTDLLPLKKLTQLLNLNMKGYPGVDDQFIDTLCQLPLTSIDLSETKINDKQLIKLARVKTFHNVKVQDCPFISPDGVAGFHSVYKMLWHHGCGLEASEKGKVMKLDEELREKK